MRDMSRKITTFLLSLASALFLAIVYKNTIFKISNEVDDSTPGFSIEVVADFNK